MWSSPIVLMLLSLPLLIARCSVCSTPWSWICHKSCVPPCSVDARSSTSRKLGMTQKDMFLPQCDATTSWPSSSAPPHQVLCAPPHGPGHVSKAVFLPAVLMLEAPQAGCWAWLKRCVLPRLVLMQLNPGQTLNTESTPRGAGHISSLVIRDHCLL